MRETTNGPVTPLFPVNTEVIYKGSVLVQFRYSYEGGVSLVLISGVKTIVQNADLTPKWSATDPHDAADLIVVDHS